MGKGEQKAEEGGSRKPGVGGERTDGGKGRRRRKKFRVRAQIFSSGKKKKTKEEAALDQMYSNPGSVSATFII